jgi:hypothetical protein
MRSKKPGFCSVLPKSVWIIATGAAPAPIAIIDRIDRLLMG